MARPGGRIPYRTATSAATTTGDSPGTMTAPSLEGARRTP